MQPGVGAMGRSRRDLRIHPPRWRSNLARLYIAREASISPGPGCRLFNKRTLTSGGGEKMGLLQHLGPVEGAHRGRRAAQEEVLRAP